MIISGTQAIESIQKDLIEYNKEVNKKKNKSRKIYECVRNEDLNKV